MVTKQAETSLPGPVLMIRTGTDASTTLLQVFGEWGIVPEVTDSPRALLGRLRHLRDPLILLPIALPEIRFETLVKKIYALSPSAEVIVLLDGGESRPENRALLPILGYIGADASADQVRSDLLPLLEQLRILKETHLVGHSEEMRGIAQLIHHLASSEATVLITGESGTGKELVARAIHEHSRRKGGPFVAVNCGAFAETLLESELFGHIRGAFTGAVADKKGFFAAAEGGTIFLDEIGETSPAVQVRLLRVLEERQYYPVGSTRSLRTDVRVLAASNRDLRREVEAGRFRRDLFYRLSVIPVLIPPLRQRLEDIPALVYHFAARVADSNGVPFVGIADQAMEMFLNYHWPGNVRELRNLIETLLVLHPGEVLEARHLAPYLEAGMTLPVPVALPRPDSGGSPDPSTAFLYAALLSLNQRLDKIEQQLDDFARKPAAIEVGEDLDLRRIPAWRVLQALREADGDRRKAATSLGISLRTLYRRMRDLKK